MAQRPPRRSLRCTAPSAAHPVSHRNGTSGPALAAALIGFRGFENLLFDLYPEIRTLYVVDPVFGAVVFAGVLVERGVVEIADFEADTDYWDMIDDDPND